MVTNIKKPFPMNRVLLLLSVFTLVVGISAIKTNAQNNVIYCSEFHVTRPLSEIVKDHPVDYSKLPPKESGDREHRKAQKFLFSPADGPQYGNDPSTMQTYMGTIQNPKATLTSWAGQAISGMYPLDPSGAVGLTQYVQMINATTFRVYNKSTGAILLTATLGNLWSPATANNGDPIVLYDKAADRWFLAQFGSSTDKKIYIAISTTGDATGSYYTYTFTSAQFPDYLKFSVWSDGYYMTSNQSTQKVYCFERDKMLAGNSSARAVYQTFSPPNAGYFFVPLPGDASDGTLPPPGTPCPIFSYSDNGWGTGYIDAINIYNASVSWGTTASMTITSAGSVPTAAFDASYDPYWNDISQPGTSQKLDGIGGVLTYRAQWKTWNGYNSVVLNWGVKISSTQRSIKWCELRQDQSTGTWSMYQEGIYTPDSDNRWLGSIAMDNNGGIGLCYSKSNSTTTYMSLAYAGRRSCDPLGTLPITETVVVAGTGAQTGTNRDGDYSQTTLDPDGVTFWHTGMYMGNGGAQKTQIFSFQIPSCGVQAEVSIAITSGSNPSCAGSTVTFTATPTNGGTNPTYQWQVNGLNVGTNSPTYTTSNLANNDVVTCIMTSDLAGVTNNPATSVPITMTINSVPVADFTATPTNAICSGDIQFTDATTGGANTWLWDFGDGQTSTLQNPTHTYLSYGTYTVKLTASNSCGNNQNIKTNYVSVSGPDLPTVQDANRCGAGTITLTANGTGTLYWYDASTGGNLVNTGNSFTTPSLSATTTYYVENNVTNIGSSQYVGPVYSGGGAVNTAQSWLIFDCFAPMRLVSVLVSAQTAGYRLIELKDANGNTLQSANIDIPSGTSRITLNFDIQPGNDYQLVAPANCALYRLNSGVSYPYTINGLVSIKNSNAGLSYYYYFFDWEVQEISSCSSSRVPVTATINEAVAASVAISASSTSICFGQSVTFTATPTNGGTNPTYQWKVNGNNVGTNNPTYTTTNLANNDIVTCQMTSNATCIDGSATVNSNPITITVSSNLTPSVSITASENSICEGTPVTFTATPTNGGNPSYQWKLNNNNVGTNSPTYTNSNLNNGDVVSCIMTSDLTCATQPTATSNAITMTVNSSVTPSISISTANTSICPNELVTFTANTSYEGANPTYQWQINGINVGNNSSTFTSNSLQNNDVVTCILTSSENCTTINNITSNSITISVDNTVPVSSFTYTQNELTFNFTNTSTGAISYLWDFGDGSTSTLENPSHSYATSGLYVVTLTAYGACDSNQVLQSINAIESIIPSNEKSFTVAIYPNPTQDLTTVELKGYEYNDVEIIVHDELGKKLYSYKLRNAFGNSKVNVDMSRFEKGIYNYTIRFNKESQHFKVIKK